MSPMSSVSPILVPRLSRPSRTSTTRSSPPRFDELREESAARSGMGQESNGEDDVKRAPKRLQEVEEAAAAAAVAAASGAVASAASCSSSAAAAPAAAVYSLLNVGHTDAWLAEQRTNLSGGARVGRQLRILLIPHLTSGEHGRNIQLVEEPPYSSFRSGFFPEDKYSLHAMPQMAVPAGATLVAAAVDVLSTHLAQVQLCLRELKRADEHAYDVTMALEQARCDNHLHRERCSACAVSPIRGLCWRCEACPNFHLCNACCQAGAEPQHHLRSHPLIRLTGTAPVPTVVPVGAAADPAAKPVAAPVTPAVATPVAAAAPAAVVSLDASEGSAAVAAASSSKPSAPSLDAVASEEEG